MTITLKNVSCRGLIPRWLIRSVLSDFSYEFKFGRSYLLDSPVGGGAWTAYGLGAASKALDYIWGKPLGTVCPVGQGIPVPPHLSGGHLEFNAVAPRDAGLDLPEQLFQLGCAGQYLVRREQPVAQYIGLTCA